MPLIADDESLGVISFYTRKEHEFKTEEIDLANSIASHAAIAIRNSQLYGQIEAYAAKLKSTVEALTKASRVKDEFLSVMSHELRTPLNVVLGYTAMIRDGMLGEVNPRQAEALDKITRRAKDQLALIKNILSATVLEAEDVTAKSDDISLTDFLNQLRSSYAAPIKKELAVEWLYPNDLPVIKTDAAKLEQIMQNLIDNAIKFTDKGSVTVSARLTGDSKQKAEGSQQGEEGLPTADCLPPTGGPWVEFKVADTGVGIPKEHLPFVFEKFRQVDSSETRLYGGVGIGLYIVKKFTELLGGTVEVESEVGKGSTFTVKLPLNFSHQQSAFSREERLSSSSAQAD